MHPSSSGPRSLLGPDDGLAWSCVNPCGASTFLLIGDHAGNRVPKALGTLGITEADRARHIGWDIGVAALGAALAHRLDAPFLAQRYSRLVIDCNRDPTLPAAIPEVSDGTTIAGNGGLSEADRSARVREIHAPYQAAIAAALAKRRDAVLVSLHSFTPVMNGFARPWAAGVLYDGCNDGFARRVLAALEAEGDIVVGDNQPYRMDATDHTVPRHAFSRDLPYVELELRQDLLAADVPGWAERMARVLHASL